MTKNEKEIYEKMEEEKWNIVLNHKEYVQQKLL